MAPRVYSESRCRVDQKAPFIRESATVISTVEEMSEVPARWFLLFHTAWSPCLLSKAFVVLEKRDDFARGPRRINVRSRVNHCSDWCVSRGRVERAFCATAAPLGVAQFCASPVA